MEIVLVAIHRPYTSCVPRSKCRNTERSLKEPRFVVNTRDLSLDARSAIGRYMLLDGHCSSATYQRIRLRWTLRTPMHSFKARDWGCRRAPRDVETVAICSHQHPGRHGPTINSAPIADHAESRKATTVPSPRHRIGRSRALGHGILRDCTRGTLYPRRPARHGGR